MVVVSSDGSALDNPSSSSLKSSFSKRVDKRKSEFKERLSVGVSTLDDNGIQQNKNVETLTINKLRYQNIGLAGRDREMGILRNCLDRLMAGHNKRHEKEIVFIKGYSGTGKTTLAWTIEHAVTSFEKGVFVQGKFEANNEESYSAIAHAFGEILRAIDKNSSLHHSAPGQKEKQEDLLTTIAQELVSELGSVVQLLTTLVPELQNRVPPEYTTQERNETKESHDFGAGQERVKYAFRVLTRVLSSHLFPIVILLDDLQWAGQASLEVIDCLIADVQNPNPLMLLGCFRSNEVDAAHILSSKIDELAEKKSKFAFNMTEIELVSLNTEQVNQVTKSLLSIDDDDDRTRALAEVCFKRTLGNPFFLIQFITMLKDEQLLDFNLGLLRWVWDAKVIEDATMATVNVVDLLQTRMRKLPRHVQLLLQYAACLGSTFILSTLSLLWKKHTLPNSPIEQEDSLLDMLQLLEDGNFIERCGPLEYRWGHDKIQEAALSLGDVGIVLFQFDIGATLFHSLSQEDVERSLFDIVDLINSGKKKRSTEFAELNLRAAVKARSIAAFHSASGYITHGLDYLPDDETKWTLWRALTLRLYKIGAEMELALGRLDSLESFINEVVSRDDCSTLEKLPLYAVRIHKLNTIDCSYQEAVGVIQSNLKELGLDMVRNRFILPFQAMASFLGCVYKAKRIPKEDIVAINTTEDAKQRAIMILLRKLCYTAYISSNKLLYMDCACKMVQMTFDIGVNNMAGVTFATLGLMTVAALGDFEAASHFGEVGVDLQKKFRGEYSEATTLHVVHSFVFPWTKPLASGLAPLLEGYTSGMRSGNIERGLWCRVMHDVLLPYMIGKPLSSIEKKCFICLSQCREAKHQDQIVLLEMTWQMILNLMGKSEEELELKGKAFDVDDFEATSPVHGAMFGFVQSELLVIFGHFERAAEVALQRGSGYKKAIPALALNMEETFHRGVAFYAMARKTGQRKFKKEADKVRKTIKHWIDKGNPNCAAVYLLLSAEQAALEKNYKAAHENYKNSITRAAKTGGVHHAALFNERYADFLLNVEGGKHNEEEGSYRKKEAIRFYRDWGAEAKVRQLSG